ncbi:hypothetical protein KRZ98_05745 [Sphingobium sp. AS12]|uniref:hypothetical protein n=1 Tax=Sphingobium sp. AS12 TaxID=2849495 RepID=UPI001C317BBD|nr:hypothetical protein [Sphingobium sp. AS12]MBV2147791.1 hypothetical protein [Sphingobium sp. AS12]
MKMYSLTEGELGELAQLQGGATVAFSASSACLGFALSVKQGFAFSENLSPVVLASWETWMVAAFIASALTALCGLGLCYKGRTRLAAIKAEMEHD